MTELLVAVITIPAFWPHFSQTLWSVQSKAGGQLAMRSQADIQDWACTEVIVNSQRTWVLQAALGIPFWWCPKASAVYVQHSSTSYSFELCSLLFLHALICNEVIICVYDNNTHWGEDCDIKVEIFWLHCMIKHIQEKKKKRKKKHIQDYHKPLKHISLIKIKVTSTMLPLEMFCQVAIATTAM